MNYLNNKEKIGFSVGEYSASIVWQTLMFFLPSFYTDTYGLSAAAAGTMFLVVRLFDAVNDPLMGAIADNTNTKWGKFRPFLLWFAIPYGVCAVLMFTVPDFGETGKIIYAYATYILMMLVYTAIMIPYNAMVGVITPDSHERTTISSLKFVFAYAAGMTVQAFVIPLVARLGQGNDVMGYRLTMMIFGTISIICFLIAFYTSKERVQPPINQQFNIKKDLLNLLKNRAWVILFLTSLFILIYVAIRSAVIVYYWQYLVGAKEGAGTFMVAGTLCVLLGVLPTKWLSKKIGKKNLFIWCMVIIGLSSICFYWAGTNMIWLYTCQIIFSLASGPTFPLIWAMLADAADYGEYHHNRRNTGLIYSAATLGQKAGFSIGGAIALWVLAWYGYEANVVQSASSLMGINLLISIIPGAIAILITGLIWLYPTSDKEMLYINHELKSRRINQSNGIL